MFTGIVQAMGRVRSIDAHPSGARPGGSAGDSGGAGRSDNFGQVAVPGDGGEGGKRLIVDCGRGQLRGPEPQQDDSVCISGVCLTVVHVDKDSMGFDVIVETLQRTSLGDLTAGDAVNLEPSLTAATPMGGHFVQGHVDGVGQVSHVKHDGDDVRLTIQTPSDLMTYIAPKGSITVEGVSLTVAAVGREDFEVALIPTTLQCTTLGQARQGTRVNLETDIISRTVVHALQQMSYHADGRTLTLQTLRNAGFVGGSIEACT